MNPTAQKRRQRRQREWLHGNLVALAMDGHDLDPADVDALPPAFRPKVKAIAEECAALHAGGDQSAAHVLAEEGIGHLDLGDWEPPRVRVDRAVIDEIRRR